SFLILALIVGAAIRFRHKQNENTAKGKWVGGEISWPKAFWLAYAIGSWFLMPWIFFLDPATPTPLRWAVGLHLASWWIRGPLELVMIYKWFNWTPVYGMSHDTLHCMGVFVATSLATSMVGFEALTSDPHAFWAWLFLSSISLAMMAETSFAGLFFGVRGSGKDKIYFASDSEEWRTINRLTFAACVALYAHLAIQTVGLWLS
ncbi:MAG TPA: hypothetical protein VM598_05210, partial [Bdellovibrionota bacterium]|nr:hypothetical protein [Bdellovibrionota bacterium]